MAGWLGGVFTREERAVVAFIAASVAVGSIVLAVRRVSPGPPPGPAAAADTVAAPASPADEMRPIDLNRASESELLALPGIGPARAAAIVTLREARGRLRSARDLLDVKGIGPRTLERIEPLVTVGAPADSPGGRGEGGRDP